MKALGYLLCLCILAVSTGKDYTGYKVLSITPKSEADLDFLERLRDDYSLDLWNEPRRVGVQVSTHIGPELISTIEDALARHKIEFTVAISDLQSAIVSQRIEHTPSSNDTFDFGVYNDYDVILKLLQDLANQYPDIAKLETYGKSYEERPIYMMKISSGDSSNKPVILIECGIHGKEYTSIAAGAYIVNLLITGYASEPEVTSLVDKYEFVIVNVANPDGYVFARTKDRFWQKTRSVPNTDFLKYCRGADPNRNFDINFCGKRSSKRPCEQHYCGDKAFSESETRALRDLMFSVKDRTAAYFSIHAAGSWVMTPYASTHDLPPTYDELIRIGRAASYVMGQLYGSDFDAFTSALVLNTQMGSSLDYAYMTVGIKISFQLMLRGEGPYGYFLPKEEIIPACEEAMAGIVAAIKEL